MMKNNQLQLVTRAQAERLRAAGFDWDCYGACYLPDGEMLSSPNILISQPELGNGYKMEDCIPAPTVALALKWMREKHCLSGEVYASASGWLWEICEACNDCGMGGTSINQSFFNGPNDGGAWDTYEAAESALLDELLNIL